MKHHGVFASQVQAFKCARLLMHSSTAMMWTQSCSPTYDLRTRHLQYATAYHIMVLFNHVSYHNTHFVYMLDNTILCSITVPIHMIYIFFMYCLSRQQKSRWTQAGNSEAVGLILGVRRPRENRSSSHGESTDPPHPFWLAPVISMTRAGKNGFCASP